MKTIIRTIVLLLPIGLASTGQAQELVEDQVPAAVRTAFTTRFPHATAVKWEQENATTYEAEFKDQGIERSANFDGKGTWTETETEIKEAELPAPVRATLARDHAGQKLKECERVETPTEGTIYEVEVLSGGQVSEVRLSGTGTVLGTKVETEKKKKEEDED